MSIYQEIYGFEDAPKPTPKPLPETPLEDWRWQITPASSTAAATCQKIADAAFTKAILGDDLPKVPEPEPEPELFMPPALVKFANKVERLQKRASERGPAVTKIIEQSLGKYRTLITAEAFQRLQLSCENYLTSAMEAF